MAKVQTFVVQLRSVDPEEVHFAALDLIRELERLADVRVASVPTRKGQKLVESGWGSGGADWIWYSHFG